MPAIDKPRNSSLLGVIYCCGWDKIFIYRGISEINLVMMFSNNSVNRKSPKHNYPFIRYFTLSISRRPENLAHSQYWAAAQPILIAVGLKTFVAIFTNIWPLSSSRHSEPIPRTQTWDYTRARARNALLITVAHPFWDLSD